MLIRRVAAPTVRPALKALLSLQQGSANPAEVALQAEVQTINKKLRQAEKRNQELEKQIQELQRRLKQYEGDEGKEKR